MKKAFLLIFGMLISSFGVFAQVVVVAPLEQNEMTAIINGLEGRGVAVGYFNSKEATPSKKLLRSYEAVIVSCGPAWKAGSPTHYNKEELGDNLAHAAKRGVGIVATSHSWIADWDIGGKFDKYNPFSLGEGPIGGINWYPLEPEKEHPIFSNPNQINYLESNLVDYHMGLTQGAEQLARWESRPNDNFAAVAVKGRVVALVLPLFGATDFTYSRGQTVDIVENCLAFLDQPEPKLNGWGKLKKGF